jgi:hypothetical protein
MTEIDVTTLKADLMHCSTSAAVYEARVLDGKDASQVDIRYAKDLAKYYRDAAEKVRNVYLALINSQLAQATVVETTTTPLPTPQEFAEAFCGEGGCKCDPEKKAPVKKVKEEVLDEEVTFSDVFNELPQKEG